MKRLAAIFLVLSSLTLACAVGGTTPSQPTADLAQLQAAVQQTVDFEQAIQAQLTQAAVPPPVPTANAPQPPSQEPPTVQVTSSVPMISVSMDTNCREGPNAEIWKAIGALLVGQKVEILAKYDMGHWYIIRNPNNPNERCWVYDGFATIEGDTSRLPKATIPPTPTPH